MSDDPNEPTHKMVNGERIALTKEEIAQIKKDRAGLEAAQPPPEKEEEHASSRSKRR